MMIYKEYPQTSLAYISLWCLAIVPPLGYFLFHMLGYFVEPPYMILFSPIPPPRYV